MIKRTAEITFQFDGKTFAAFDGETISAALLRVGKYKIRSAPNETPRGIFCGMGVCQECVVEVNGKKTEACRTKLTDGLIVRKVSHV
jgi:predicted molibdopterin-dependent oxidoreductase YjgC